MFGYLPIEAIVFGDAGLAWYSTDPQVRYANDANQLALASNYSSPAIDDRAFFLGGDRTPVFSAGAGLRMNVFGIMIVEFDWVYPFNRVRGGHFQFSFTPGF